MWITATNYRATPVVRYALSLDSYTMAERQRDLPRAVHLTDPHGSQPEPDPDCLDCRSWVKVRDDARARNDYMASAAAEELRVHMRKCQRRRAE